MEAVRSRGNVATFQLQSRAPQISRFSNSDRLKLGHFPGLGRKISSNQAAALRGIGDQWLSTAETRFIWLYNNIFLNDSERAAAT